MSDALSASARRVEAALRQRGIAAAVREIPAGTRTAAEAADAIGCRLEQIAKSIVFRTRDSDCAILVILRGTDRVDESRVAALVGEPVSRAKPDFVRERTGYVIGGVPPTGHTQPLASIVDDGLLEIQEIWAAAGTPNAVVRLTPEELLRAADGRVAQVREGSAVRAARERDA